MCVNVGSAQAKVMGYLLAPGEGLDFTQVGENEWMGNIQIEIQTGAAVRITRLRYSDEKKVAGLFGCRR